MMMRVRGTATTVTEPGAISQSPAIAYPRRVWGAGHVLGGQAIASAPLPQLEEQERIVRQRISAIMQPARETMIRDLLSELKENARSEDLEEWVEEFKEIDAAEIDDQANAIAVLILRIIRPLKGCPDWENQCRSILKMLLSSSQSVELFLQQVEQRLGEELVLQQRICRVNEVFCALYVMLSSVDQRFVEQHRAVALTIQDLLLDLEAGREESREKLRDEIEKINQAFRGMASQIDSQADTNINLSQKYREMKLHFNDVLNQARELAGKL
ncbi:MAG: hypothetical protein HW387_1366 [Parachlamydiales bacterium]|nr:hypothetical protein [Parachlamydiales bacterium]